MKRIFILLAIGLVFFPNNGVSDDRTGSDSDYQRYEQNDTEFSIDAGVAYSYWDPQDIGNAEVKTSGINLFWVEFKSKTLQNINKKFSVPKLRYETSLTGDQFSYDDDEVIRSSDSDASYMHFLGMVQIYKPITFRYETEKYIAEISPKVDMNYIPFSGQDIQTIRKGEQLYYETTFHDYALQYEFKENIFLGVFYSEYQKPYSATISGIEIFPESIFYSKISSWGIISDAISIPLDIDGLTMSYSAKLGWGEIELADNYKISELLTSDKGVAFFNPQVTIEYEKELHDNIVFRTFASVDYRFFYQSGNAAVLGEDDINSDLLLKCFVSVAYLF